RVWQGNPTEVPPRSHQCLGITDGDGGRWLGDVGFGGQSPLWPVGWDDGERVDHAGCGTYRMGREPAWGRALYCVPPGAADERLLYTFSDEPQLPVDFTHP